MVVEATRVRQYPMVGSCVAPPRAPRVRACSYHATYTLVVENLDGRPNNADRLTVGAVREINPTQAIVGGGKTDPGHGVARMLLDGETDLPPLRRDRGPIRSLGRDGVFLFRRRARHVHWLAKNPVNTGLSPSRLRRGYRNTVVPLLARRCCGNMSASVIS